MHAIVACLEVVDAFCHATLLLRFDENIAILKNKILSPKTIYLILEWFYKEPEIKNMTSVKTNIYVLVSSCFLRI